MTSTESFVKFVNIASGAPYSESDVAAVKEWFNSSPKAVRLLCDNVAKNARVFAEFGIDIHCDENPIEKLIGIVSRVGNSDASMEDIRVFRSPFEEGTFAMEAHWNFFLSKQIAKWFGEDSSMFLDGKTRQAAMLWNGMAAQG